MTACDDCGACCFEQGSPPGYFLFLCRDGNAGDWPDREDVARYAALPAAALQDLRDYRDALKAGFIPGDGPCCWLDVDNKRCRYYEHRPQICRDLDVGSEGCQCWRDEYNIDVERFTQ